MGDESPCTIVAWSIPPERAADTTRPDMALAVVGECSDEVRVSVICCVSTKLLLSVHISSSRYFQRKCINLFPHSETHSVENSLHAPCLNPFSVDCCCGVRGEVDSRTASNEFPARTRQPEDGVGGERLQDKNVTCRVQSDLNLQKVHRWPPGRRRKSDLGAAVRMHVERVLDRAQSTFSLSLAPLSPSLCVCTYNTLVYVEVKRSR